MLDDQAQPQRDMSLMTLGTIDVILIFSLYLAISVYSAYEIAQIIHSRDVINLEESGSHILALVFSALCGAAAQNTRRLYRAGINNEYTFNAVGFSIARLSTIAFFVFRPVFSIIVSIIVYSLWRLSVQTGFDIDAPLSDRGIYTLVTLGFFSGFSSGRILDQFENESRHLTTGLPRNVQRN